MMPGELSFFEGDEMREPAPYTLHPTPCTLHPTPYTLHPTPYTLHPTPYTLQPTPYTLSLVVGSDDEDDGPPQTTILGYVFGFLWARYPCRFLRGVGAISGERAVAARTPTARLDCLGHLLS